MASAPSSTYPAAYLVREAAHDWWIQLVQIRHVFWHKRVAQSVATAVLLPCIKNEHHLGPLILHNIPTPTHPAAHAVQRRIQRNKLITRAKYTRSTWQNNAQQTTTDCTRALTGRSAAATNGGHREGNTRVHTKTKLPAASPDGHVCEGLTPSPVAKQERKKAAGSPKDGISYYIVSRERTQTSCVRS